MRLALIVSAAVGTFGIVWCWLITRILADTERERCDLARDGRRCQPLTRYQR